MSTAVLSYLLVMVPWYIALYDRPGWQAPVCALMTWIGIVAAIFTFREGK